MSVAKVYVANGGRWVPLAGGPVLIPPPDGGGAGPVTGPKTALLMSAASGVLSGSDFDGPGGLDEKAGPLTGRRSYDSDLPATIMTSNARIDVGKRAILWSCHPDLDDLRSGALDSRIQAFVASIPPTQVAFLTCWHEPDHKARSPEDFPGFTIGKYLDAFTRWCQVVKQAAAESGRPHVYTMQVVEAWSGSHPKAGTTYDDMWPGDGLVDVFAVDGYSNEGTGAAVWGAAVTFATRKNIPWGIAELGCAVTMDTQWMADQVAYADSHPAGGGHTRAAFVSWFSNPTGGVLPTPGTDTAALSTAHALSLAHYSDVNAFVL